jgi:hypothetical protein
MRSAAQKLLCVMSLGALMVPALSFAATDNPFASVERSADTMLDTGISPDVQTTDTTRSPTIETPSDTPIESFQNKQPLEQNESLSLPPPPPSAAVVNTPNATSSLGNIISGDKDVASEAKVGEDNKLRYEKLSDFAGRFNDKLFG